MFRYPCYPPTFPHFPSPDVLLCPSPPKSSAHLTLHPSSQKAFSIPSVSTKHYLADVLSHPYVLSWACNMPIPTTKFSFTSVLSLLTPSLLQTPT